MDDLKDSLFDEIEGGKEENYSDAGQDEK